MCGEFGPSTISSENSWHDGGKNMSSIGTVVVAALTAVVGIVSSVLSEIGYEIGSFSRVGSSEMETLSPHFLETSLIPEGRS